MAIQINGNQIWNTILFDALWPIDMIESEQHIHTASSSFDTTSLLSPLLSKTTLASSSDSSGEAFSSTQQQSPLHFLSEWNQRRIDQGMHPYNALRLFKDDSGIGDKSNTQVEVHLLSPPYDTCPPTCLNRPCWLMVAIQDVVLDETMTTTSTNEKGGGGRQQGGKRRRRRGGNSWRLSDAHDPIPFVWTHRNADIESLQSTFRDENVVLPRDLNESVDATGLSLDSLAPGDWHLDPKRRWLQQRMKRAIGVNDDATSLKLIAGFNLYMPSYMPSPTMVHASRWIYGHSQSLRDHGYQLLHTVQFILSCIYCRSHYTPLSKMWIGNPATMREALRGTQFDVPATGDIHNFSFFLWLTKHLVNIRRERSQHSLPWHQFQMQRATYGGVLGSADHVWPLVTQLAMGVWDMGMAENERLPARDATTGELPAQQGRLPPRSDPRIFFSNSGFDVRASAFCFADHFDSDVSASRDWLVDIALGRWSNRTTARLGEWYRQFATKYPSLISRGVLTVVGFDTSSPQGVVVGHYALWRAPDEKMSSQGSIGNMSSVRNEMSDAHISPEDRAERTKSDDIYKAQLVEVLKKVQAEQRELQSAPFNPKDNKVLQAKIDRYIAQLNKIESAQQSEMLNTLAVRLEQHYHANDIYGWPTDETFGAKRRALTNLLESLSILYRYNGNAAYMSLCDYLYPLPEWAANGPIMALITWLIIQSWRWWCTTQWWPVVGSNIERATSLVLARLTQQFMPWLHMGGYRAADIFRAKRNMLNMAEGVQDGGGDDYLSWTGGDGDGESPFALRDASLLNDVYLTQLQTLKTDMQAMLSKRGCMAAAMTSARRWFTGEVREWCDEERAWVVQYVEFVWRVYPSFTGGAQMDAVFGAWMTSSTAASPSAV